MAAIWPIGLPALVVLLIGAGLIRRNWTPATPRIDAGAATPAVPAERLQVSGRDLDLRRVGQLVDPARPTLGGRLRQTMDPALAGTDVSVGAHVATRRRRRRPLTARDAA